MTDIVTGGVYHVGAACGVPFTFRPIYFRVIRVHTWTTWQDTVWLDGYELDQHGNAVERRTIYVSTAGLRLTAPKPARVLRRIPRNDPPAARVPRPRTTTENIGRTR